MREGCREREFQMRPCRPFADVSPAFFVSCRLLRLAIRPPNVACLPWSSLDVILDGPVQLGHLHVILVNTSLASSSTLHLDRVDIPTPLLWHGVNPGDGARRGRFLRTRSLSLVSPSVPAVLDITMEPSVIGDKLVVLDFVHTDDLGLVVGPEMETGDEVDEEHDGVGDDKGPGGTDGDPGDLFTELSKVAVEPSSLDHGVTVVGSDRGLSKPVGAQASQMGRYRRTSAGLAHSPVMKVPIAPAKACTAKTSILSRSKETLISGSSTGCRRQR